MAKINHILFGQGKGKVGGMVLQRYEGMNIVREKPISVKNPQSTKQTEQRAKFKMSSQITAQFFDVFNIRLADLSIYDRTRRGACINAITKVITTTDPDNPQALVQDVVAAINAKSISGIAGPQITGTAGSGSAQITAPSGDTTAYVLAAYNATTGKLVKLESETYLSSGTPKAVSYGSTYNVVIMAVSYHALTDAGRATISNIMTTSNGWQNEISRSIQAGDVEVTNINGTFIAGS